MQVFPADVVLQPGETAEFKVRLFDANGEPVKGDAKVEWSLPAPPAPMGGGAQPPPLGGKIEDGKLTVNPAPPGQFGLVQARVGELTGQARVRIVPKLPYAQPGSHLRKEPLMYELTSVTEQKSNTWQCWWLSFLEFLRATGKLTPLFTGTGIVPPNDFTLCSGDTVRINIPPVGELVNEVE